MISRQYYFLFLASSIFSAPLSIAMEEPNKEINPIQSNRLANAKELVDFAEGLFHLANNKQWKEVLSKAFPDPLKSQKIFSKGAEYEAYCYYRFAALAMAHKELGDQESSKRSKCSDPALYAINRLC